MAKSAIWKYPPLDLFDEDSELKADRGDVRQIAANIEALLTSFNIETKVVEVNLGPAVTQYCLEIKLNVRISDITSLASEIALVSQSPTGRVKIEAPIPGRNLVGIEIPNRSLGRISLRIMLSADLLRKSENKLAIPMGFDTNGNPIIANVDKMPHAFITGTTGSGKSVLLHSIISTLLFRASPKEVKLLLIDTKGIEFHEYKEIPHLISPVIENANKSIPALKWVTTEIANRMKEFTGLGARNIYEYNELIGIPSFIPSIVIVVDELDELMSNVDVKELMAKIIQNGRIAGVHLILSSQKQSNDILTKEIDSNIPTRISFYSPMNPLNQNEYYYPGEFNFLNKETSQFPASTHQQSMQIQGPYISNREVYNLVAYIKKQSKKQVYKPN